MKKITRTWIDGAKSDGVEILDDITNLDELSRAHGYSDHQDLIEKNDDVDVLNVEWED
jgi:hypothetical protein